MGEPAELSKRRSDKPTTTTAAAASLDALHGRVTDEIDRRPSRRARVDRSAAHARARCDADSARRRTSRPSRPASPADPKAISDALAQLVEWGNLRRSRYEPSDERRGLPPRAVPVPAHPRRRGRGSIARPVRRAARPPRSTKRRGLLRAKRTPSRTSGGARPSYRGLPRSDRPILASRTHAPSSTDDRCRRYRPPEAAAVRRAAVVAQHVVAASRDDERPREIASHGSGIAGLDEAA